MDHDEIRQIREKLGMTQEKFAQKLGATVVTVNRWENGHQKPHRLYITEIEKLRDHGV